MPPLANGTLSHTAHTTGPPVRCVHEMSYDKNTNATLQHSVLRNSSIQSPQSEVTCQLEQPVSEAHTIERILRFPTKSKLNSCNDCCEAFEKTDKPLVEFGS
jgi:hypothetical protein